MRDFIARNWKAIGGAVVGAATYVSTSGIDFADPQWWAAGVIFLGAGYGIVWITPANKAKEG